jgi:hypothetical protein
MCQRFKLVNRILEPHLILLALVNTEICVWLSAEDRAQLESWLADRNTPQKLVWRSRIVLLSAARVGTMSIAREVGKSKPTVWPWQERYVAQGIAGLKRYASRPGRKPPLAPEVDCASGRQNPARETPGGNPVEHPDDGPDRRPVSSAPAVTRRLLSGVKARPMIQPS